MNQKNILIISALAIVVAGVVGIKTLSGRNETTATIEDTSQVASVADSNIVEITPSEGLVETLPFVLDGKDYTLGPIPAHFWKLDGSTKLVAEHYSGSQPFAWASDVPADTLLYEVDGVLGSCSNGYLEDKPTENGFVHFHGSNEDNNVGFWLKHTVVTAFTWEGPPGNPDVGREVPLGVDLKFPNICEFPAGETKEALEGESSDTLGVSDSVVEVKLEAKQWEFVPSEVRVRLGDTVRMTITSSDVDHGFAINEFGVSEKIPAGETVTFEFVADKKGTYRQYCNVVCGLGHAGMIGDFIVE